MHTRRKFEPRLGSAACASGVQGHGDPALFAGSLSVEPEPSRSMKTPNCHFSILFLTSAAVSEVSQQPLKATQAATVQKPRFKLFPL